MHDQSSNNLSLLNIFWPEPDFAQIFRLLQKKVMSVLIVMLVNFLIMKLEFTKGAKFHKKRQYEKVLQRISLELF